MNEREFIKNVELSGPNRFAEILHSTDAHEQELLARYFGAERLERMKNPPALDVVRGAAPLAGTIVLLPGILGSELWEPHEHIWLDVWSIIKGDFDQLQVNPDGSSRKPITAPAVLKRYYGEMTTSLHGIGKLLVFPFDWRLDIAAAAQQLKHSLDATAAPNEPVFFVAHSMGGLVVRSLFAQYPAEHARTKLFIMMGTPNLGSYEIPALYFGLNDVMKLVAFADQQHYMPDLLQFAKYFTGTYQMLPFFTNVPAAQCLYDTATYGPLNAPADRFDRAKTFQSDVSDALDSRCRYIAGAGEPTKNGIRDWNNLSSLDGYTMTTAGDGTVPHALGIIDGITAYFVHEKHSNLPSNQDVIQAVLDLLATGDTTVLPKHLPAAAMPVNEQQLKVATTAREMAAARRVRELRDEVELQKTIAPTVVTPEEIELQRVIFEGQPVPSTSVPH
jgi:pimeloyl-ACP methyl ester carboxylesterase